MPKMQAAGSKWENDDELLKEDGIKLKQEDEDIDEEALLGIAGEDDVLYEFPAGESLLGDHGDGVILQLEDADNPFDESANASQEQLDYEDLPDEEEILSPVVSTATPQPLARVKVKTEPVRVKTESDSDDEDKKDRGRFQSERKMISLTSSTWSKKKTAPIPETLEVSAEMQKEIESFETQKNTPRGRGRGHRGRGRNQRSNFNQRGPGFRPQMPQQPPGPQNFRHGPQPRGAHFQQRGTAQPPAFPHEMVRQGVPQPQGQGHAPHPQMMPFNPGPAPSPHPLPISGPMGPPQSLLGTPQNLGPGPNHQNGPQPQFIHYNPNFPRPVNPNSQPNQMPPNSSAHFQGPPHSAPPALMAHPINMQQPQSLLGSPPGQFPVRQPWQPPQGGYPPQQPMQFGAPRPLMPMEQRPLLQQPPQQMPPRHQGPPQRFEAMRFDRPPHQPPRPQNPPMRPPQPQFQPPRPHQPPTRPHQPPTRPPGGMPLQHGQFRPQGPGGSRPQGPGQGQPRQAGPQQNMGPGFQGQRGPRPQFSQQPQTKTQAWNPSPAELQNTEKPEVKKLNPRMVARIQRFKQTTTGSANITVVGADIIPHARKRTSDTKEEGSPEKAMKVEPKPSPADIDMVDPDIERKLEAQRLQREMVKQRKEARRLASASTRRQELMKKLAQQGKTLADLEKPGTTQGQKPAPPAVSAVDPAEQQAKQQLLQQRLQQQKEQYKLKQQQLQQQQQQKQQQQQTFTNIIPSQGSVRGRRKGRGGVSNVNNGIKAADIQPAQPTTTAKKITLRTSQGEVIGQYNLGNVRVDASGKEIRKLEKIAAPDIHIKKGPVNPNRTVIPEGQAKVVTMERKVVAHQGNRRVVQPLIADRTITIEGFPKNTGPNKIKTMCKSIGPIERLEILPGEKKAIVEFGNQQQAAAFVKKYDRQMFEMGVLHVKAFRG